MISESTFKNPSIPLVDGRGKIWSPFSTDIQALYRYTLGDQVTQSYDFTSAVTVAIKEFCPDKLVLLGPGNTLGGAIGQILIQNNWQNLNSKKAFLERQNNDPYLVSMGMKGQKNLVC
jgi:hypothetical protein